MIEVERLVHPGLTRARRGSPSHGLARRFLISPDVRIVRFLLTGSVAALVQLVTLATLLHVGWNRFPANALALTVGAQVSFLLGNAFTWRDRREAASLPKRWLLFHGTIAVTAALNMVAFSVAQLVLPMMIASAGGIGVAAVGNFLASDRLVFR